MYPLDWYKQEQSISLVNLHKGIIKSPEGIVIREICNFLVIRATKIEEFNFGLTINFTLKSPITPVPTFPL